MDTSEVSTLEGFYVFRSLHSDESWGALIIGSSMPSKLPNIDFGMKVYATNEKEAIGNAKTIYDRIHAYDSDKENIRRFAAAALKYFIQDCSEQIAAEKSMKYAVALLDEYNKHFNEVEKENNE